MMPAECFFCAKYPGVLEPRKASAVTIEQRIHRPARKFASPSELLHGGLAAVEHDRIVPSSLDLCARVADELLTKRRADHE
jgi:hypothetical protein